jgi:hypothetical protein
MAAPAGRGGFSLYRIGDAWAARNIHAAMLDAMRALAATSDRAWTLTA